MPRRGAELKEAIKEKWDESSERYDSFHGHGIKSDEERKAWMHALNGVLGKGRLKVLDVGCGTGELSLLLAEMGHLVVGIDLSERMLALARSKAKSSHLEAQFESGDAEALAFGDESFDIVLNRHLLWTLPQPEGALREWKRVLKDDGKLIIIDGLWNDGSLNHRLRRYMGDLLILLMERSNPRKGWYSKDVTSSLPHPFGMSAEKARDYLRAADFQDIRIAILSDIRDIQRSYMPLSQKVSYNFTYYMISGRKSACAEDRAQHRKKGNKRS